MRFNINPRKILETLAAIVIALAGIGLLIGLILLVSKYYLSRMHKHLISLLKLLKARLMYNSILRYILQKFFRLSLTAFFNLRLIFIGAVSSMYLFATLPIIVALIAISVYSLVFMQRNKNNLYQKDFNEKYGTLYAKVEMYNHPEALKYPFYFCLRRLLNAIIIALCNFSIVLQVLFLVQVALLMTCWAVKTRPMTDSESNFALITNEIVVLICSYLVLLFTEFVPTPEDRLQFGYVYLVLFLFESFLNVIMLLIMTTKDVIKLIRRYRARKSTLNIQVKEPTANT